MTKNRIRALWIVGAGLAWLVVVGVGQRAMLNYEFAPAVPGTPPTKWPEKSKIQHVQGIPTIVMVAHPRCPCTRATIEELARMMVKLQNRASVTVVFVRFDGLADDWEKTDLWRSASAIPGVSAVSDPEGVEALLFGAQASGQTMLYSASGDLQFSGGITASRGHSGDNPGHSAIVSLVTTGSSTVHHTSIYGCSLHSPERAVR